MEDKYNRESVIYSFNIEGLNRPEFLEIKRKLGTNAYLNQNLLFRCMFCYKPNVNRENWRCDKEEKIRCCSG
jgi:hypothetical protein